MTKAIIKLVGLCMCSTLVLAMVACCTTGKYDKSRNDAILAQLPTTPTVTLAVKDTPVVAVLSRISNQMGIEVTAVDPWLAGFPIAVDLKDATVAKALTVIIGNMPCCLVIKKDHEKIVGVKIIAPRGEAGGGKMPKDAGGPESFKMLKPGANAGAGAIQAVMGTTDTEQKK